MSLSMWPTLPLRVDIGDRDEEEEGNQRKREKERKREGRKWNYKRMKGTKKYEKYLSLCCSEIFDTVFHLLFLNTMKMLSRGQHNHVNLSKSK